MELTKPQEALKKYQSLNTSLANPHGLAKTTLYKGYIGSDYMNKLDVFKLVFNRMGTVEVDQLFNIYTLNSENEDYQIIRCSNQYQPTPTLTFNVNSNLANGLSTQKGHKLHQFSKNSAS